MYCLVCTKCSLKNGSYYIIIISAQELTATYLGISSFQGAFCPKFFRLEKAKPHGSLATPTWATSYSGKLDLN